MNEIIYRQDAIDSLANMYCKSDSEGYVWIIRSDAWAEIDALPPAQPEECKRGKWLLHTDERFDIDYYKCSECGYEPYRKMDISNFCPNCGADMRGIKDE